MEIDVVRPLELTPTALDRWSALQQADPALDSPFFSPQWARAVDRAQSDGTEASEIKVAVVSDQGREVGFLPVRARTFTAMPAGAPMCDYQGLVAEPGLDITAQDLVRALGVGRFDFTHMLETQPTFARHSHGRTPSWLIDVSQGYAAYEAERKAAGVGALKDLDKKRRKVEREAGPVRFTAFSRSRTDFDQLIAWKRGQFQATGQTDVLATPWTRRLINDLFESRDPDFGGVMFTLHIGERLAAAHFHLRGRHTVHGWQIAHDCDFERYSPGLLLFQDILRWMDETPYSRLDLGAGDYRFKRELSNLQQYVTHGFVGVASPAALLRQTQYALRHAAESMKLGAVSELPGKAMRRLDIRRALR
ncbi:MAG: cellulose biosynthesis protein CelD [Caulobacter sp.]|nr:cellulose biosynthesis protein CelD [Caulobacter sp.]